MATIKQLIEETTDIKNKLETCHTSLKGKLREKGISFSESDKMKPLIDKVNEIGGRIQIIEEEDIGDRSISNSTSPTKINELDPNNLKNIESANSPGNDLKGIGEGQNKVKIKAIIVDDIKYKLVEVK